MHLAIEILPVDQEKNILLCGGAEGNANFAYFVYQLVVEIHQLTGFVDSQQTCDVMVSQGCETATTDTNSDDGNVVVVVMSVVETRQVRRDRILRASG